MRCAARDPHTFPGSKIASGASSGAKGKSRYNFFLIALFIT